MLGYIVKSVELRTRAVMFRLYNALVRAHLERLRVEEGSKAASVRLQAGDEIVGINEVPLSGYRQEAICLVKGSHRTLTLVVKRKMKMVDIVAQKMPSESDVHVARSFLTKILRSSMRRNEPASRPHSWHSTKFTESQSEAAKTQVTPTTVWHTRYDASSSSHDLSSSWDQTNLRRVSDQFSSLGSMDSLEHSSHPYPPGRLSPTKSNNSIDHLAGGGGGSKRDSAYSSFSTSSSTPDYPLSKSNAASTENMLYKVNQWESSGRHGNGRHSQSLSESGRTDERQGYLQLPPGTGGRESPRAEELPGTRYSSSGRSNIGPVWHVPEKKKRAPSPPPPPPPVRSDSFAATKVHEKGLAAPYLEGSGPNNPQKPQTRRSYNPPPKTESLPPHISMDTYNNNQLNSNKLYSLSSTDVRVGQPPYTAPHHQRQYSDESTFYPQPRSTSVPKQQNVGSYYSSMQELPTDVFNQNYNQAHVRTSSASLSSAPIDQNMESTGHSRYYCVTARQPAQTVSQASLVRVEGWKGSTGTESAAGLSERGSTAPQKGNKAKYPLPQPQQPYPDIKDSNGQKSNNGYNVETHYMSYPPSKHDDLKKYGGVQPRDQPVELWVSEEDEKISPLKTPMLHSLAQESMGVPDMPADPQGSCVLDPLAAKQVRRSDRYATTLRNEIQMKRAQLQKSKSAATLTGPNEAEEDAEVWKAESTENSNSSSDGSFSSTYKDHLKEAQARVLRATSFRRRDLEPVLLELPGPDAPPGYSSSAVNPLPGCSEVPQNKASSASGSGGPHMSRIGGRKRFTQEQKVRSYSEPDKMNEVGVGEAQPHPKKVTSFADRRKFFEATSKTGFSKPAPRQTAFEEHGETRLARKPHPGETEESWHERRSRAASFGYEWTFAEYEATWNEQRKPSESRTTGRYHSADNILDAGAEECTKTSYVHERSRSSPSADFHGQNVPVQGRKTADYSQRDQKPAGFQNTDDEPPPARGVHSNKAGILTVVLHPSELSDGGHRESRLDQKRPVSDQGSEPPRHPSYRPPPAELLLHGDAQSRDRAATLPGDLRHHDGEAPPGKDGGDVNPALPTRPEHQAAIDPGVRALGAPPEQPGPGPGPSSKKRGPVPQRPPPPKLDKYRRQETTTPSPQFAPQRLTDKPPVSLQDEAPSRVENVTESNAVVKKVPIKIVHAESSLEKQSRQYLLHSVGRAGSPEGQDGPQVKTLGSSEHAEDDKKTEELAREIVGKDKSLADILNPSSRLKTTMDLMQGIFPQDDQLLEGAQQRRKVAPKQASPRATEEKKEDESLAASALVTSSSYYSTSAPKAELLIKMKDMQEQIEEQDSEDELDNDLSEKKVGSVGEPLEDVQANNALGDEVEAVVQQVCKPNEFDKFRMFIGDLDKVVSLLLSLSGRLARVENALNNLDDKASAEEKRTLMDKRKLLIRQHEDAKELKENLDRRERVVFDILASYLSEDNLADYEHFVKMKSALIIEQRKLEDKIKLGEEQLKCLTDSLPLDHRVPF
ncbi:SHRM2 protein, partial [Amia calva]|nr:SHRM2 protein [Amia calva]